MKDAMFDVVRDFPLPVRLALLHEDPEGAGFYIKKYNRDEIIQCDSDASEAISDGLYRYGDRSKPQSHAWLPRNPLAVLSVAAQLYGETPQGRDCWPVALRAIGKKWVLGLHVTRDGETVTAVAKEDEDALTAAIEVLREVVGG